MKPLSAVTAPIIARLADRMDRSMNVASAELRRMTDQNRKTIEKLTAGEHRTPNGEQKS
jgi:hypothetical protein